MRGLELNDGWWDETEEEEEADLDSLFEDDEEDAFAPDWDAMTDEDWESLEDDVSLPDGSLESVECRIWRQADRTWSYEALYLHEGGFESRELALWAALKDLAKAARPHLTPG